MTFTGDAMHKERYAIKSIDKILEYLERDINNPEKTGPLDELIDVHALLTHIKAKHIESTKSKDTNDDLYLYSLMVMSSFEVVFGNWDAHTKIIDDRVLLYNDLVYMDINRDTGITECVVSFYYQAEPVIIAEVISTLKDIFGAGLKVSSECFTTDEATGNYIWGDDAIKQHLRNINGNKIKPIIFFDDGTVGNC